MRRATNLSLLRCLYIYEGCRPGARMAKLGAEPPDEMLVVAAILGDLEAFDELALRYRAAVVRAAQAIVGREDAEDVAQDALLLAFKALPSIEDPAKFAAWLSAITRHRAFRFGKRESAMARAVLTWTIFCLKRLRRSLTRLSVMAIRRLGSRLKICLRITRSC